MKIWLLYNQKANISFLAFSRKQKCRTFEQESLFPVHLSYIYITPLALIFYNVDERKQTDRQTECFNLIIYIQYVRKYTIVKITIVTHNFGKRNHCTIIKQRRFGTQTFCTENTNVLKVCCENLYLCGPLLVQESLSN